MEQKAVDGDIQIAMAILMVVGPVAILYLRTRMKNEKGLTRGISARLIQLLAVVLIFPTILILALSGRLDSPETGTLLGTLVGYLLSPVKPPCPSGSESND